VETEMSYKMAIQLVMKCLETYSCEEKAMLSSVQLFLTCVIQFEKCTTDKALPESKRHEVADDVKRICSNIIEWMKKMNSKIQSDKENYLKVVIRISMFDYLCIDLIIYVLINFFFYTRLSVYYHTMNMKVGLS
jgi:hypothetical protein